MAGQKKIIVLGGGIGALTAAYHLTSAPGWKQQYEVVLYQLGWRLGGKCASSRNPGHHGRIEEHGLHVWFGFYQNAFALLRSCYAELGRASPLARPGGTFEPRVDFRMYEQFQGEWLSWDLPFEDNGGQPGLPANPEPSEWTVVIGLVEFVEGFIQRRLHIDAAAPAGASIPAIEAMGQQVRQLVRSLNHDVSQHTDLDRKGLVALLAGLRELVKVVTAGLGLFGEDWHRVRMVADLCLTAAIGIVDDDLLNKGLASISDQELLAWLEAHGADPATTDIGQCVPLRALYDTCFAFEDGDVTMPNFAAGVAIEVALRIGLTFQGSPAYMTLAGMGEVAVAPLYECLEKRGVRFEFFQRVLGIDANPAGTAIEKIRFSRQATVLQPPYDPLLRDAETPYWPNRPKYGALAEGAVLQAQDIDLESHWTPWTGVQDWTLPVGPDDQVVLGISLGALPQLCADLGRKNQAWRDLLAGLPTIQTQSMQLWLRETSGALGWPPGAGILPTVVAAPEPHDVWADMSQLLAVERWPIGDAPKSIQYYCGPMPNDYLRQMPGNPQAPALAAAQVRTTAQNWLQDFAGWMLPGAALAGSRQIDWNVLFADAQLRGPDRLGQQWLRANIDPTERYVLSPAARNALRLAPDGSGFANLVLAGDWTRTAINAGCVEAAVMSGMAASRALCGLPAAIHGEHFLQG
jgi:uncharacterized protein with NAD-binding domain and iron-sulfur cluster